MTPPSVRSVALALDLAGEWTILRRIRGQGRFVGVAQVAALGPERFSWRERGVLTLISGERFAAFRDYIYILRQEPARLEIRQGGPALRGEALHDFQIVGWNARAHHVHLCGADRYAARMVWLSPRAFRLAYRVQGPRKDYVMATRCRRVR
jgi:hypothetical protein